VFERYTEPARRALFFARYEVAELGGRAIETEHLLLGVLRQARGLTWHVLDGAQVQIDAVRADARSRTAGLERLSTSVEIPFSDETKRILQAAMTEADRLSHNDIGTEHLLLGILCEPETAAGRILTAHGITRAALREELARLPHGRH
jgi:ATP-dependent Clp protease ATP-binding subunit ClpC